MGLRRERPSEQAAGSVNIRLRDGSRVSVSIDAPGKDAVASAVCCFCGESVEDSDPRRVTVAVRWPNQDREDRSWSAHDTCLADRLHDRADATGSLPDR